MTIDVMAERSGKIVSLNDADVVNCTATVRTGDHGILLHRIKIEKSEPGSTPEVRIIVGNECVWSALSR